MAQRVEFQDNGIFVRSANRARLNEGWLRGDSPPVAEVEMIPEATPKAAYEFLEIEKVGTRRIVETAAACARAQREVQADLVAIVHPCEQAAHFFFPDSREEVLGFCAEGEARDEHVCDGADIIAEPTEVQPVFADW